MSHREEPVLLLAFRVIRESLLLAAVLLTPLVITPGLNVDIYSLPKLTLLGILVPTAAGIRAAESVLGRGRGRFDRLGLPAVALLAPLTIAWLASPYTKWAFIGAYTRFQGLLGYVLVALLGVLIVDAFFARERIVAWVLVASGAVVGGVAFIEAIYFGAETVGRSATGYPIATFGHSNFAGAYLAIVLPVAIALARELKRPARFFVLAAIVLLVEGIIVTFSQGAWAAAVAGSLVTLGLLGRDRWRLAPKIAAAAAAAIALFIPLLVVLASLLPRLPENVWGDILGSVASRRFIWEAAVDMILESPLVGRGPDSFAIEGVLHRPAEDALLGGYTAADDPHSVPLAFATSAGILGLAGFAAVFVWIRYQLKRFGARSCMAYGFVGALVAYLVQSLGSIDEIPLRTAFWIALAGTTLTLAPPMGGTNGTAHAPSRIPHAPRLRLLVAVVLVLAAGAVSAWIVRSTILADVHAARAVAALAEGDAADARAAFQRAVGLRDAYEYRDAYGQSIGRLALDEGQDRELLLGEMRNALSYLDRVPGPQVLAAQARVLHAYSRYDPESTAEALPLFEEARKQDPYNPVLAIETSDALRELGLFADSRALLNGFVELLEELPQFAHPYRDVWGALALTEFQDDRPGVARIVLEAGRSASGPDCRYQIAQYALATPDAPAPGVIQLLCPHILWQGFLESNLPASERSRRVKGEAG